MLNRDDLEALDRDDPLGSFRGASPRRERAP
jgi:hypothetical protein